MRLGGVRSRVSVVFVFSRRRRRRHRRRHRDTHRRQCRGHRRRHCRRNTHCYRQGAVFIVAAVAAAQVGQGQRNHISRSVGRADNHCRALINQHLIKG